VGRTRVHYFVWFSLILGNPLLFALGWVYPVSRTSVPTAATLDTLVTTLQLLGALLLALWALGQIRTPLPALRARDYLVTGGLYAACILMILLNSLAFAWPLAYRIADVMLDQAFAAEYGFHSQYNFWCCHPDIGEVLVDCHRRNIEDSLRRYGLDDYFYVDTWPNKWCDDKTHCLVHDRETPLSLGGILRSIEHAKQFRDLDGLYYERYVLSIPQYLVISLLLGRVLLLLSTAPVIKNRRLGRGPLGPVQDSAVAARLHPAPGPAAAHPSSSAVDHRAAPLSLPAPGLRNPNTRRSTRVTAARIRRQGALGDH